MAGPRLRERRPRQPRRPRLALRARTHVPTVRPRPTTAMTTVVSVQNGSGNSWTRRSVAGSKVHVPAAKNSSWNSVNAWSKKTANAAPATVAPMAVRAAPRLTARHHRARLPAEGRASQAPAARTTTAATTMAAKVRTTRRTSSMWDRSRASKTGTPSTSCANVPAPATPRGPRRRRRPASQRASSRCMPRRRIEPVRGSPTAG